MAKRAKNDSATLDLVQAFVTLFSFDATEDNPVLTDHFADEMGVTPTEAFTALDSLADVELVDAKGRGLSAEWWITVPDVSAENAESIAREALDGMVPVVKDEPRKLTQKEQDYAERTEYNAAVSASQEEGGQHLHPMEDAAKAVTPVIAKNGETVTIPVDFDDPSKGRRELDAAKGERLISEDVITVKVAPAPERLPEIDGLDQFIDAETGDMVYESRIVKNGLALDAPSEIPERPAGVHPNTWDLAHTAITQTARDYWTKRADDQAAEYTMNNGAPAPF